MCLPIKVHEPGRILGEGVYNGYEWAIAANNMGFRCGYIKVTPGHPWHGAHYDQVDAFCHGGLTYSERDEPCEGEGPDNGWWVGFDCAHAGDSPDPELITTPSESEFQDIMSLFGMMDFSRGGGTVYTQEMVQTECKSLCLQAAEAAQAMV